MKQLSHIKWMLRVSKSPLSYPGALSEQKRKNSPESRLKFGRATGMAHLPDRTAGYQLPPTLLVEYVQLIAIPETQTPEPCRNAKHQRNLCHEPLQDCWRNPAESSRGTLLLMKLLAGNRSPVAFPAGTMFCNCKAGVFLETSSKDGATKWEW